MFKHFERDSIRFFLYGTVFEEALKVKLFGHIFGGGCIKCYLSCQGKQNEMPNKCKLADYF